MVDISIFEFLPAPAGEIATAAAAAAAAAALLAAAATTADGDEAELPGAPEPSVTPGIPLRYIMSTASSTRDLSVSSDAKSSKSWAGANSKSMPVRIEERYIFEKKSIYSSG